jgi:hypothetical protein
MGHAGYLIQLLISPRDKPRAADARINIICLLCYAPRDAPHRPISRARTTASQAILTTPRERERSFTLDAEFDFIRQYAWQLIRLI